MAGDVVLGGVRLGTRLRGSSGVWIKEILAGLLLADTWGDETEIDVVLRRNRFPRSVLYREGPFPTDDDAQARVAELAEEIRNRGIEATLRDLRRS